MKRSQSPNYESNDTTAYLLSDPEGDPYDGTTESYELLVPEDKPPVGKTLPKKKATGKSKRRRRKVYADSDETSDDDTEQKRQAAPARQRSPAKSPAPSSSTNSESDDEHAATYISSRAGKLGRPRGKARPRVINFNNPKAIKAVNFRRDNVDEDAARRGVIYQRWRAAYGHITSHVSVRDLNDETIIPAEQEMPGWCMLCPKNKYVNYDNGERHYLVKHQKSLVVIGTKKLWHCKCSQLRSHGNDMSARNAHYHCMKCFQPCRSTANLANHVITGHRDVDPIAVRHLQNKPL